MSLNFAKGQGATGPQGVTGAAGAAGADGTTGPAGGVIQNPTGPVTWGQGSGPTGTVGPQVYSYQTVLTTTDATETAFPVADAYTLPDKEVVAMNCTVVARGATGILGANWNANAGFVRNSDISVQPTFMGAPVYQYRGTQTGGVPSGMALRAGISTGATASGTFQLYATGQAGTTYLWLATVQLVVRG